MTITAAELILYGAASRPEDDVSTTGGAQDGRVARPLDTQLTANAVIEVVSDGADTRTITVTGRDAGGAIVSEGIVLNGTSAVAGSTTFERILKIVASAADGSRTVTVRQGVSGATRHTLNPSETDAYIHFQRSTSSPSNDIRYEKSFFENTNTTDTLTSPEVTLTADPSSRIRIALETTVDGTNSVSNRTTTPTGISSFQDDSTAIGVTGGELAAGEAIGVWVELDLPADDPANRSTFTLQLAGQTT